MLKSGRLPHESDHPLDNAMANCVCRVPEIRVRQGSSAVKRKVQALVAVYERPIRVVEEVIT